MKIKEKMLQLGLNPKKELIKFFAIEIGIIAIGILSFILLKDYVYFLFAFAFCFIFGLVFFSNYGKQINAQNQKNIEDFAVIFGFFRIYIRNGFTVYSALKEIIIFANPSLQKLLEELIEDIDKDKSVQPFVKFAKNFDEVIVEEMMISIYQMIDDGEQSEYLKQFELIFDKFSEIIYQKNLKKKDSRLGTFGSAPLVASCYLIITLTIGIVDIIGGLINGI